MVKKDWALELGQRTVPPADVDEVLQDKVSERKRKQLERQEELDEATHKAKMAELAKREKTSEIAVDKADEKKGADTGFKVTGGVNLGNIDLDADRKQAALELKELKKEQEETIRVMGRENEQLREKIHEQEMKVITTTFQAAIATLNEKLSTQGTLAEKVMEVRTLAKEFGMTQSEPGVSDPALQIQMLQLQHSEAMRERQFQWDMMKHKEEMDLAREKLRDERESKKKALEMQEEGEKKRNNMLASAPEIIGRVLARGLSEGGGEGGIGESQPQSRGRQAIIEAGVGEAGETDCVSCKQPIAIGPTARVAVCANCGARYSIKRIKGEAVEPAEAERSGEEE